MTHGLSRVCTAALGRTLLMTAMMGADLKSGHDKVTAIIKGGGPAGNIVCTGNSAGAVKGYIENPALELPLGPDGKLDVSSAVGWYGALTVLRDMGLKEPYTGRCAMVSGEIAEDFAQYFTSSEQQPSLVYLGVRVDSQTGKVRAGGGLLLQPLPHCPEETLDRLQAKAEGIQRLAAMLEEGLPLKDALSALFDGMDLRIVDELRPAFCCDCNRERLEKVLISLGREELRDMIEQEHGAELTCHFCNTIYRFDEAQLRALLREAVSGV
jgi:molecular chaperone Hsp33